MSVDSILAAKSKAFAIRVIKLYKVLREDRNEHIMSKQFIRSGTSIGANVREAIFAQSKADFVSKLNIALKEAGETAYWLELLSETNYLKKMEADSMIRDCEEVLKLLTSTIKHSR